MPVFHIGACGYFWRDNRMYQVMPYAAKLAFEAGLFDDFMPRRFSLSIHAVDTMCIESFAAQRSLPLFLGKGLVQGRIYSEDEDYDPVIGIVGCQCSGATLSVANLAISHEIPVVSGSATSADLSDKFLYPTFLRTIPPDDKQGRGLVALLQFFQWKRAVVLTLTGHILSHAIYQGMLHLVANTDIELIDGDISTTQDAEAAALRIRETGTGFLIYEKAMVAIRSWTAVRPQPRIFICVADNWACRMAISGLGSVGLLGGGVAHLASEESCSMSSLSWDEPETTAEALNWSGWPEDVIIKDYNYSRGLLCLQPKSRGPRIYSEAFKAFWLNLTCSRVYAAGMPAAFPCSDENFQSMEGIMSLAYYPLQFDAMTALIGTVSQMLSSGVEAGKIKGEAYLSAIGAQRFDGLSGTVAFDGSGDRLAPYLIMNMQLSEDNQTAGLAEIGLYDAALNSVVFASPPIWHDGGTAVPIDVPEPCAAGEEYIDALTGCQACGAGRYFPNGGTACIECLAGTFRNETMESCDTCPAGHFCPAATVRPVECGLGHSCIPGSKTPAPCVQGKFASMSTSTACSECSLGKFANSSQSSACLPCEAQIPGSTTEFIGRFSPSSCVCPDSAYLSKPIADAEGRCKPCLQGLQCSFGLAPPLQAAGMHAGVPAYPGGDPPFIIHCSSTDKCPAGRQLGACPANSEGLACDLCKVGFLEIDGQCVECKGGSAFGPAVGIFGATVAVLLFFYVSESQQKGPYSQSRVDIAVTAVLTLNMLQNMSALGQIDLQWIEPVKSITEALDALSLSFSAVKPTCTFSFNQEWKGYVGSLLAYPSFALSLLLLCCLGHVLGRRLSKGQILNMQGSVMLTFFMSIAMLSLNPLQCGRNPDGSSSLILKRSIICWEAEHATLVALALLAVFLYLVPFLAVCIWAAVVYPRRILLDGSTEFVLATRFLFSNYHANQYAYGVVFVLRKLTIALIPTFCADVPLLQVLLLGGTFTLTLCTQIYIWPWRTQALNFLDTFLTASVSMMLLGGCALLDVSVEGAKDILQVVFVIIVLPSALAIFVWPAWPAYALYLQKSRAHSISISYERSGAKALARWFQASFSQQLPSRAKVFLDMDGPLAFDVVFDKVGYESSNLVVLLTKEAIRSMMCAAHIAAAVQNKVNIVPVACEDYSPPSDAWIDSIQRLWDHSEQAILFRADLDFASMKRALRDFKQIPTVPLRRGDRSEAHSAAASAAVERCMHVPRGGDRGVAIAQTNSMAMIARTSSAGSSAADLVTYITGEVTDAEVWCTADLLRQMLLQLRQEQRIGADVRLLSEEPEAKAKDLHSAGLLLVLLTRGLWYDHDFQHSASIIGECVGVRLLPIAIDAPSALPVQDLRKAFGMTTASISPPRDALPKPSIQGAVDLERVADVCERLLSATARNFTVSAPSRTLRAQVIHICTHARMSQEEEDGPPTAPPAAVAAVSAAAAGAAAGTASPEEMVLAGEKKEICV